MYAAANFLVQKMFSVDSTRIKTALERYFILLRGRLCPFLTLLLLYLSLDLPCEIFNKEKRKFNSEKPGFRRMPVIFRARICGSAFYLLGINSATRHSTRHRHFTRHKTRQLGILLGIGILLSMKLGNRYLYQVTSTKSAFLPGSLDTIRSIDKLYTHAVQ